MKSEINATIAKYEKRKCNVALHDQQKNIAFKFPRVKNVLHYSAYRAILLARFYTMKSTFDELKDLIDYIQSVYTEITDEWLRETPTKTNLKNALVADIDADGIIYKSIMEYVQLLNEKSADITLPLASVCSCKVTARVKAQNSIEFKIQNYKTERHEFGKIPINKCINDLFGIRIFLREPLTFDEVYSFIEDTYPNRYRCIDSSKFDYKAVHLYFKENNQSFPWELQIWNMCDMDSNFSSQKKYKQEYTAWEKESKEGGIIND